MTRKQITTRHQVVSCDVCGRTLLRGERAEPFLAGGSRRTVCELCTPRATHEGWIREGLQDLQGTHHQGRDRRGSLLRRLRRRDVAPRGAAVAPAPVSAMVTRIETAPIAEAWQEDTVDAMVDAPFAEVVPEPPARQAKEARLEREIERVNRTVHAVPTNTRLKLERALDLFNGSDAPRRIAGIARSLGVPIVAVRPSPTEGAIVSIVVAWELCWYGYEVDLADEATGARLVAQGTELDELAEEDRTPNAAADEHGALVMAQ